MTYFMVDVEADGPIPGEYSMVSIGVVVVEPSLDRTFYAQLRPISEKFVAQSLAVSSMTREQTLSFEDPRGVMERLREWVVKNSKGPPVLISDNNGFDAMFVAWYFHHFLGENPFGHSSQNLGSLYKGLAKSVFVNFKHLRQTPHTHNALDDARGNAEAFLAMAKEFGLKVRFE